MNSIETPFRNFFNWIRVEHSNWYAIIISISVLLWVNGMIGLIEYYLVHKNTVMRHWIVALTGLGLIYLNDGKLTELHVDNNGKIKKMMEYGAVASSNGHKD